MTSSAKEVLATVRIARDAAEEGRYADAYGLLADAAPDFNVRKSPPPPRMDLTGFDTMLRDLYNQEAIADLPMRQHPIFAALKPGPSTFPRFRREDG